MITTSLFWFVLRKTSQSSSEIIKIIPKIFYAKFIVQNFILRKFLFLLYMDVCL